MSNPPAFQFYASDYLSSSKVQRMTLEAEGAYIRLLAYSWQDGFIPADVAQLARMCKASPRKMAALWDAYLRECFVPSDEDPDKLVSPRLEEVRNNLLEFKAERSQSGKTGAAKRWQSHGSVNSSATPQPVAKNSSPSPSPSPSSGESNTENNSFPPTTSASADRSPEYTPEFNQFWERSTKRGSKLAAFKAWRKLRPSLALMEDILSGMFTWKQSEQWQDETKQPHISTWLNRRGWEELVPAVGGRNERNRSTAESRDDATAQAAARLLARIASRNSGSVPGGSERGHPGGVSGKIIEIPVESLGDSEGPHD